LTFNIQLSAGYQSYATDQLTHRRIQITRSDFDRFDYIFAMDLSNLSDLERLKRENKDSKAKVMLYGDYSGTKKPEVVSDPYYGGQDGFDKAFEQCSRFAKNFLQDVVGEQAGKDE
jgi:low molecular weight phosphotyrosine protein phosphatase